LRAVSGFPAIYGKKMKVAECEIFLQTSCAFLGVFLCLLMDFFANFMCIFGCISVFADGCNWCCFVVFGGVMSCRRALQRTATHCNALQRTATHCDALQRTATHCNMLQRTATCCNALQHAATHCNMLQRTATCCNALQACICHSTDVVSQTHCNALQHAATHCNALQRTATHCNTLQAHM